MHLLQCLDEEHILDGIDAVRIWSDAGPSFRSWTWLAMLATEWACKRGIKLEAVTIVEKHGKHIVDSLFSELHQRRTAASMACALETCSDVMDAYAHGEEQQRAAWGAEKYPEFNFDFVPPPKTKRKWRQFLGEGMDCALAACHSWEFNCNDKKRRMQSPYGKDKATMTGAE